MNWSRRFGVVATLASMAFVAALTLSNFVEFRMDHGRFYDAPVAFHDTGLSDIVKAFAAIEVVAPRVSGGEGPARSDVLFASHNQPGQDWRIAATTYRHIDPGRRAVA